MLNLITLLFHKKCNLVRSTFFTLNSYVKEGKGATEMLLLLLILVTSDEHVFPLNHKLIPRKQSPII